MAFAARPRSIWQLRTRAVDLGVRTCILGIVNATPDSFSGDGRVDAEAAVAHGLRLLDQGADGLDVGGESTRPGSGAGGAAAISTAEEQDRVMPVLEGLLRARPGTLLSVDTYRAATARAAVGAGAEIVNDVSGFAWDTEMAAVCATLACGVVVMHTRGRPAEWKQLPQLAADAVVPLVREGLARSLAVAHAAGIAPERVVLDPGYGFGKAGNVNFALLSSQTELLALERPLLAGLSRKSFLALALQSTDVARLPAERDPATAAACVAAILAGASVLRVHAVGLVREAATIADAVLAGGA